MRSTYNRFAGNNKDRLAALSDGVFAVALTLLVLDLRPPTAVIGSEHELLGAIVALGPQFLAYLMSFMTLGIFWIGQQTQLNHFDRCDRDLSWIHIGFLLTITLMPFSTALLAHDMVFRTALVLYWLNIVLSGAALYASWRYATRAGLVSPDTTKAVSDAMFRRIVIAQSLYALGGLLCVVNTYVSVAAIILVQVVYVLAPRFAGLRDL